MKKYNSPVIELSLISQKDIIMYSGELKLDDGERLMSAPSAWFGMDDGYDQ